MNKFTPGPWEIVENTEGNNTQTNIINNNNKIIVQGWNLSDENAFLIAASPELYQALIDLLEHAETQSEAVGFSRADTAIYNRCRAVLTQARGEK